MSSSNAYILMGGNLGNVRQSFQHAINALCLNGQKPVALSHVYTTEAWGMQGASPFLNQALCLNTPLKPDELMRLLLDIEVKLGRIRRPGELLSRCIDLDILIYDELIIKTPLLEIPHPRMHLRRFALAPLADLAPDLKHPILGKSIGQLLNDCTDQLQVIRTDSSENESLCATTI